MIPRPLRCLWLLGVFVVATSCSRAYWIDRGRDALDVVTVGIGMGVGARAQVGPVGTGLDIMLDGYRLRGGIHHETMGHVPYMAMNLVGYGFAPHVGVRKEAACYYIAGVVIPIDAGTGEVSLARHHVYVLTQVEVSVGVILALRIGVNPGELIDLFLGFAALDIYGDDVEMGRQTIRASTKE